MTDTPNDPSRRDLLKGAAMAGAGLALGLPNSAQAASGPMPLTPIALPQPERAAATMVGVPFEKRDVVRVAIVGTGLRGRSVLHELLGVDNVKITAICDTVPEKLDLAVKQMREAGHTYEPARFTGDDRAYERLVQRDDIDLVYTATPWQWHVPIVLAAMRAGKHAATEVPAAYTIEDCWKIVDTSERTRRHCIMMENCSYGYNELLVLNMVRAGAFGELKHGGAAYNHDLREILFENRDEGLWRRAHHTLRNANLYPTHGLGPVAAMMNINRGDKLDYLVSMSTPEMGLTKWRADHEPKDSPTWAEKYVTGDLSVSLIKTAQGRTIRLEHDVSSPRPYSRINSVQGTKGIFEDYPARIYIEGDGEAHRWMPIDGYKAKYEHALWKQLGDKARAGGHGGMDYVMAYRLIQTIREGLTPDMDVYDAAAWSAPGPLSEISVAKGSMPIQFPDFTRGNWSGARAML
ncbi:MAG: Gfo/Idh/MocA family oxidoreductase [Gemmatimonadaceae bacterium]|nr:Gfo/Idh/MocA family oxidoreductase [Gemmatimonadaceae bacterium]